MMALGAPAASIDMRRRAQPNAAIDMGTEANVRGENKVRHRSGACSWRLLLLLASLILLLAVHSVEEDWSVLSRSKSTAKSAKEGILTVVSKYQRPIVMATLYGYPNDRNGCRGKWKQEEAVAKVAVLSDQRGDSDVGSFKQVGEPKRRGWLWEASFRLSILPPSAFEEDDLCFEVHWRVEYADEESALSDFPSGRCSFLGAPRFHSPWTWDDLGVYAENWLVRKTRDDSWDPDSLVVENTLGELRPSCPPSLHAPGYSVAIIGDSQPHYMCQHLIWELRKGNPEGGGNVRCVQIKQTLQNETTFNAYVEALQNAREDVVIFNPSGLWEAAYGSLDAFRENFRRLLQHIPARKADQQRHLFAPTTAVHPVNYKDLAKDERKWSMTQVRVRELNRIARQLVEDEYRKRGGDCGSLRILPTPIDALSLDREDDPKTPSDMRHFGNETNAMLLRAILCDLDRHPLKMPEVC